MTDEERRLLPAQLVAPAQARSVVRRLLALWDADEPRQLAELLTSELVTNAVVHAATEIMLRVEASQSFVRVEVGDTNPEMPRMRPPGVGGYGLRLVDQLATSWGAQPAGANGKIVWFEIDLTREGGTDVASE